MIIRHLPYFVAAAEEENFQRAAARLSISQPALSRRIQDLESELGVTLFERAQGRVRLTETGRAFAAETRRIVDEVETLTQRMRQSAKGLRQILRIGFNENAIRHRIVTDAIRTFRTANTDVDLQLVPLSSAEQLVALRAGRISAGFLHLARHDVTDLARRQIRDDDQYVLAMRKDHPLAGKGAIRLASLADEEMIWPSHDLVPALHDRLIEAWTRAGLKPRISMETTSSDTTFSAVSAGLGIGLVRLSQSGREPSDVVLRKLADLAIPLHFDVAWLRSNRSRLLRKLLDAFPAASAGGKVRAASG